MSDDGMPSLVADSPPASEEAGDAVAIQSSEEDEETLSQMMQALPPAAPPAPFGPMTPSEYLVAATPMATTLQELVVVASAWCVQVADSPYSLDLHRDLENWVLKATLLYTSILAPAAGDDVPEVIDCRERYMQQRIDH